MTFNSGYTNLELVARCDTWPYYQRDPEAYKAFMKGFYYFMVNGFTYPFGYIHSSSVSKMRFSEHMTVDHRVRLLTLVGGSTPDERSRLINEFLRNQDFLGKWYDEAFPIFSRTGEHVLSLDRCGTETFGVIGGGVHVTGYTQTKEGIRYWVPRRSRTKMTYPGMLDNTVGGTLTAGETPLECMIREAHEEACLSKDFTKLNLRACEAVSFHIAQNDAGSPGSQPQIQYLYELELPEDMIPTPGDGEAEEFKLMNLKDVIMALRAGEFKLNCAMTWMAYLIRNGYVTAENEPNYVEICARLHRKHDLFIV